MFMKFLKALLVLILIVWGVLSLRPKVEIIYPQGENALFVSSMYGDFSVEVTDEMLDDWKYGRNYLKAGESDTRYFPLRSNPNHTLGISWFLMSSYSGTDYVFENGEPLLEVLHIKRSDVDFCHLEIYVDPKGKIIKQEKYKGICIK